MDLQNEGRAAVANPNPNPNWTFQTRLVPSSPSFILSVTALPRSSVTKKPPLLSGPLAPWPPWLAFRGGSVTALQAQLGLGLGLGIRGGSATTWRAPCRPGLSFAGGSVPGSLACRRFALAA